MADITQKIKIEGEGGDQLFEQFKQLVDVTEKAATSLVKVGEAGTKAAGGLDTTSTALAQLSTAGEKAVGLLGKFSSAANQLASVGAQVAEKITSVAASINTFGEKITTASGKLRELAGEAGGASGVLGEVGAKIGEAAGKIVELSGSVAGVAATMGSWAVKAGELALQLTLVTTALVSMGVTWGTVSGTIAVGLAGVRTAAIVTGATIALAFSEVTIVILVITTLIAAVAAAWAAWGPSAEATAAAVSAAWARVSDAVKLSVEQVKQAIADWVTTPIASAWQWLVDAWNAALESIMQSVEQLKQLITDWVATPVANAWQWIVDTYNGVLATLQDALDQATAAITAWVTTPIGDAWQWIVDAWNAMLQKLGIGRGSSAAPAGGAIPGQAAGGLLGGRGSGTSDSNLAWVSRGEYVVPARIVQQPGVLALLEALRLGRFAGGGSVGPGGIPAYASGGEVSASSFLSSLGEKLHQVFDIIKSAAQVGNDNASQTFDALNRVSLDLAQTLTGVIKTVDDALRNIAFTVFKQANSIDVMLGKAADILQDLANSASKATGKAGGGLLGGRGSGTSDSNLAWLSRGEYVVPARAVGQPGVLAFLEALRLGGGDLRDVLDGMGRFALGGMAGGSLALPAFAGGGIVPTPGHFGTINLMLPDGSMVTGMTDAKIADGLRRASAMSQIRSGGRKPSRYS